MTLATWIRISFAAVKAQATLAASNLDGVDPVDVTAAQRRAYDNAVDTVRQRAGPRTPHGILDECVIRLYSYAMTNYVWTSPGTGKGSTGWQENGCAALTKPWQQRHARIASGSPAAAADPPAAEPVPEPPPPPAMWYLAITEDTNISADYFDPSLASVERGPIPDPLPWPESPGVAPEVYVAWAVPDDGPDPAIVTSVPDAGGNWMVLDAAMIPDTFVPMGELVPYKGWYHQTALSRFIEDVFTSMTIVMEDA